MKPGTHPARASRSTRRRLAAALRALHREAVNPAAPTAVLWEGAGEIEALAKRMKEHPRLLRRVGFRLPEDGGAGREFDYGMLDMSPLSGLSNPLSPPMLVDNRAEKVAVGIVAFPATFASPFGCLHNGWLAAAIDEVFGSVLARLAKPAVTGILDVRFQRPCPIEEQVRIEGRVRRITGSTIFTEAAVLGEGRSFAEADAVFFVIGEESLRERAARRNRRIESWAKPLPAAEGSHRRSFADALRAIASEVVARDLPESLAREAAVTAEALEARMSVDTREVQDRRAGAVDACPVTGRHNPVAPPMVMGEDSGSGVTARIVFSDAHEGAPGLAHGGVVAAVFDEFLRRGQPPERRADRSGMLKVRYRTPCPLHTDLSMHGRVKRVEGGRISVRGSLHAGEQLVADAAAIFATNDPALQ